MELIPTIEIGKKYLWLNEPIELECPRCGHNLGTREDDGDMEGAVLMTSEDYIRIKALPNVVRCTSCSYIFSMLMEGWYAFKADWDKVFCVPYTQLTEIEGVDYELQE